MTNTSPAVESLCPKCGMCCNGVLFGDVELGPGDDRRPLKSQGIQLFKKGRKTAFGQPCSCLVAGRCRIYPDRPHRCAQFECGLLKKVQAGTLSVPAALRKINEARRRAEQVQSLVRQLGDTSEHLPLNKRYAAIMKQPIDFSASEAEAELRGELMMAVSRLANALERDFLV